MGRMDFKRNTMYFYLGKNVASAVAILRRVPASERSQWLKPSSGRIINTICAQR